jgi:hypothetical protein
LGLAYHQERKRRRSETKEEAQALKDSLSAPAKARDEAVGAK